MAIIIKIVIIIIRKSNNTYHLFFSFLFQMHRFLHDIDFNNRITIHIIITNLGAYNTLHLVKNYYIVYNHVFL